MNLLLVLIEEDESTVSLLVGPIFQSVAQMLASFKLSKLVFSAQPNLKCSIKKLIFQVIILYSKKV